METKEENLEIIISKFINFFCHRYLLSNDCCSIKKAMCGWREVIRLESRSGRF